MKRTLSQILPILLGISLLVSGGLKGIDPYGTSLKLAEYFRVWGWESFVTRYALAEAVALCAAELFLGLLLLTCVWRKTAAWSAALLALGFTALTGWLAFSPMGAAVGDCGCFGEAFTLDHRTTFLKNIGLLALAAGNLWLVRRQGRLHPKGLRTTVFCFLFSIGVPLYSAICLPPFDFLPYNLGTDLSAGEKLAVFGRQYEDVTDSLLELSRKKPLVAVVARRELVPDDLRKLSGLLDQAETGEAALCLWTLPDLNKAAGMGTGYVDEVTLKSLLRAEAGLVVVEDGLVRAKRNLSVYRPERFGRPVTALDLVRHDERKLWRYAVCVLTGLVIIAFSCARRKNRAT